MSMMRTFLYNVAKSRFYAIRYIPNTMKKSPNVLMGFVACRMISSHHISKNIEMICQDEKPIALDDKELYREKPNDRPLLVMLCWLMSKRHQIMKYANLYVEQGFDVVTVSVTPWQLMWPVKGVQVVAKDLLNVLDRTNYERVMLHGFSVGGYVWGEVLEHIHRDRKKYDQVVDRIVGQVWDSMVDVSEITIGVPKAVFYNNPVMEKLLQRYMEYHMKTFHKQATQHYIRASQLYHTSIVRAPALFLLSNTDLIGTVTNNLRARDSWSSLGIPCYVKIFDKSQHVGHFRKYPKEYAQEIFTFLEKLNLIKNEEKIRARIQN